MTRINIGISPASLTDKHLLAEHHEIKRICSYYEKWLNAGADESKIPPKPTLNKGHVSFFYDKPIFTLCRYHAIREECLNRGFAVADYSSSWDVYKDSKHNNLISYEDIQIGKALLLERIKDRIISAKHEPRYKQKTISRAEAINLLNSLN